MTMQQPSCDDAWRAVGGDALAHLFPVGAGACLCGSFRTAEARERASCYGAVRSGELPGTYRPYCPACLGLQGERWLRLFRGE